MPSSETLRALGLFDARVPRYTSYPPANHFQGGVSDRTAADWMRSVAPGSRVSLYLHIPYCRRLCWFCACRTQGTSTDRPLVPYLRRLKEEIAIVDRHLPQDVVISQIHLGGGTPTLLGPAKIEELGASLSGFRPWAPDMQFSVEIDPTEVDAERLFALRDIGMTRASIGVQDFDPIVQEAIGRTQPFDLTRNVVDMIRATGIASLNMDILYGLPHQSRARMTDSVQRVLSLNPDRVALYGYAHVPWMAKRQVMIPADALPDAEARLDLFDTAQRLFAWDGYREVGIDHFARPEDGLAEAVRSGTLRRNFQGYTDDTSEVLIGLGASAISRYPQGFAQNAPTSSDYATRVEAGDLPTVRGHVLSREDRIRSTMIEELMCSFSIDLACLADQFDETIPAMKRRVQPMLDRFSGQCEERNGVVRLVENARLIARIAAQEIDAYAMPEGRHSRAL